MCIHAGDQTVVPTDLVNRTRGLLAKSTGWFHYTPGVSASPACRIPPNEPSAPCGRVPNVLVADLLEKTSRIIGVAEEAADMRRRMRATALEMDAAWGSSGQTQGGA